MHFLAFLFFAGLIGVSFALIRSMFADANDKIEAALAGEYDLKADRAAPIYVARRRPTLRATRRAAPMRRIAA
ncbi:MAG: hypothetical protein RIR59_151 [Pseudomonadota bacterium]|jgi:hypothetical protein